MKHKGGQALPPSTLDDVLFGHSSFSLLIKKQWRCLCLLSSQLL